MCQKNKEILTLEQVKAIIREEGIEMLKLDFVDLNGINKGKLLPVHMLDEIVDKGSPFCSIILAIGMDNSIAEVQSLTQYNYDDMMVVADPSTFTILPHLRKTALLLGDIYHNGSPMLQSPRWFLKNMINEYHNLNLEPIIGSELEFFLFNKTGQEQFTPYTNKSGNCYTNNVRIDPQGFLTQLTKTLEFMNFNVLYMNHEFFPGQYEYNWGHCNALRNAEETTIFKGICKDIAEQNDKMVTFMGKPMNDNGGSGCHFHISLNDMQTGENIFYDKENSEKMSVLMRQFIAGVMKHAKSLTAVLAPTINCYKRYCKDSFAPYYVGWGYDNRTTYLRVPQEREEGTRVEVRVGSAAVNPYTGIAAILAAGLDGILNELTPPKVITTNFYHDYDHEEPELVPRTLSEALIYLEKDEWICKYASTEFIDTFVSMKKLEVENFQKFVTNWEWDSYSYHI